MTMNRARFTVMTILALSAMALTDGCRDPGQAGPPTLFSISAGQTLPSLQVTQILRQSRLILVGEHHGDPAHHAVQLAVIRYLTDQSIPLAIGLEMFRKDQQSFLDQWINGQMIEKSFKQIYMDNWNFPWPLYRDIFVHARDHRIPMVGLNISRDITKQVARDGFGSLSAKQRGELEGITCNVTLEYRDFIRSAFGAHGHGNFNFSHFCEAQLVWDTAMAINAIDYLDDHPERTMVLLAGSGHVRKMGIPHQFSKRTSLPFTVLLPQTPGIFEPDSLAASDADYIVMP